MPDIKVADNIIIEGHHRFIAAKLCGQEPLRRAGVIAPSLKDLAYPIKHIKISLVDNGNR